MLVLKYAQTVSSGWTRLAGQVVYGILHRTSDTKALDFSAGVATMLPFDGNNARFGKTMPEMSPRTNFFQATMTTGVFTLTDSDYGDDYQLEIWATASVSGVKSRTFDTLLCVKEFPWSTQGYSEKPIVVDIKKKTDLIPSAPATARYEAFCAFSYDSTTLRMGYNCWLEKDGQVVTNPISCTLRVVDSSGTLVFNSSVPAAVGVSAQPGFFVGEHLSTTLYPDDNYTVIVTIVDASSVSHTSGSSIASWD